MDELMFSYDQEADVLYMSIGRPAEGMDYVEVDDNTILRVHPETREVVGVTIIDFAKRVGKSMPLSLPIKAQFDLVHR